MSSPSREPPQRPRLENAGLVFRGESEWTPAVVSESEYKRLLAASNRCGRPNADVLTTFVSIDLRRTRLRRQIDFPPHFNEQEAALYERPFALLRKRSGASGTTWWSSPHRSPALRAALARLTRYLAASTLQNPSIEWRWIEEDHLPDADLVAIARDDDFTHAVLASPSFARWRAAHRSAALDAVVASFPFPWPPDAPLGSLTRDQQDLRSAAIRAHLRGDTVTVGELLARHAPDRDSP